MLRGVDPQRPQTSPTGNHVLAAPLPPASWARAASGTSDERDSNVGRDATDSASQTMWPSSASSWWWRSKASWLKHTSRSTAFPCERTASTPTRTWYMHGPPLISAGYVRKVSAQYPVRAAPVVRMSPPEITPSPDSRPGEPLCRPGSSSAKSRRWAGGGGGEGKGCLTPGAIIDTVSPGDSLLLLSVIFLVSGVVHGRWTIRSALSPGRAARGPRWQPDRGRSAPSRARAGRRRCGGARRSRARWRSCCSRCARYASSVASRSPRYARRGGRSGATVSS